MRVVVVMAGGVGERFWPLSRRSRPKQLLALTGDRPMLVETVGRARRLVPSEQVYIVAGPHLMPQIRDVLPDLPAENFLVEPEGRNTAPCLAFAAAMIGRRCGQETVMAAMAADSLICDLDTFERNAELAFDYAEHQNALVTVGIRPSHPNTGYGYLEVGAPVAREERGTVHQVLAFREKPDPDTARRYVESGDYLWNSGMFFWKVSTLMKAFDEFVPEITLGARRIAGAVDSGDFDRVLNEVFDSWPKISIDCAVMEKASNVYAVAGEFDWDDVGTWTALARTHALDENGNLSVGKTLLIDTVGSILHNQTCPGSRDAEKREPILVTLGVRDLIVVLTDDAVLVCHRDRVQEIKKALQKVREEGYDSYL